MVLAFSSLGLLEQGLTMPFLLGVLVFRNDNGHARNYDSIAW